MQVKKQQSELNMEEQTDFKSGKENIKAVYCHPGYLTYMQSHPYGRKQRRTKEPLDESERGE